MTSTTEHSTQTIDLTKETNTHKTQSPSSTTPHNSHTPSFKRHYRSSHPTFNHAYHRVVSRQEREYDRTNPNLVRERIDVAEERQDHPSQQHALSHVTRAYVAVGYTHATLTIIVCALCAALLLAISHAVASDVARKTRDRASELIATAAECSVRVRENHCVIDGDHVSHPSSYEMAALCKKWVTCANRGRFADSDARSAKVWAETLADIVNTFAERLSSTTIITTIALLIVLSLILSSSTFNFIHRRATDDSIFAHHHTPSTPLIAHSPSRHYNDHQPAASRRQPNARYIDYKSDSQSTTSSRRL